MNPIVNISVLTFTQLFEGTSASEGVFPLAVDTYQRGFVWNDEKIRQLTKDLVVYQKKKDPKPPYYMGTVLIHKNASKKKRFIIDGQQRLTALCILHQKLKQHQRLIYLSPFLRRLIRESLTISSFVPFPRHSLG